MSIYCDGNLDVTGGSEGIDITIGNESAFLDGSKVEELLEKLENWHNDMVDFGNSCKPEVPNY